MNFDSGKQELTLVVQGISIFETMVKYKHLELYGLTCFTPQNSVLEPRLSCGFMLNALECSAFRG